MSDTGGGPRFAASRAPDGLPGLDRALSRVVSASDPHGAGEASWQVLDTGPVLEALGLAPAGTVLAVHGNPTWSYLWRRLASASLERARRGEPAWRVVAPDQLEMGYSERTGRTRTLADRVRDLDSLTSALALDGRVVALGHDWGGVVAVGWAVDHPDLLTGLMLLNTAVDQPDDAPIPAPLRLALAPGVLPTATTLTPAFLDVTLRLARPRLSPEVRDAYRAPYRTRERRSGIGAFVADIPTHPGHPSSRELDRIADGVARLTVPSLLLWGPEDPIFRDRYLDDLVHRLPHADVHRFEGAGHLVAEDVDYATPVLDWLAATPEPGSSVESTATAPPVERSEMKEASRNPAAADESDTPRRALWSVLDDLADSRETALVELATSSGVPRTISWALLSRRVRELAAGLADAGVGPGDRVSLLVPPGADLTAALYACLRIGAVAVVADAGLGVRGLTRALRGGQPDVIIGARTGLAAARALGWPGRRVSTTTLPPEQRLALRVATSLPELARRGRGLPLPPEPAPDATAAVLFTSGSTGPAKGVVYDHGRLEALCTVLAERYGVRRGTGLVAGFAPFALLGPALGARTATPDMDVSAPRTLTARAVGRAVSAVDADVVFLSPAAIANVVATGDGVLDEDRAALERVRLCLSAGAPVAAHLLASIGRLMPGAELHTPYGMTEGLLMTDVTLEGILDAEASAPPAGGVCVGNPVPGVRIRIAPLDDEGRPAASTSEEVGVTGEIVVSAPHLKRGYDRLWLTDGIATRGLEPGGWHRTGDVGHLDAHGRLWVEGRLQHVAVTPEGVVTPVGPEQRIGALAGVGRAGLAAIGPRGTQQLVAVVETSPPARRPALASAELAEEVRAAAGVPLAAVLVVPRLPTDIRHNSKIDRSRLSRWADGVLRGGRLAAP